MRRIQRILPSALDDELVQLGHAQNVMRRWPEVVGEMLSERSAPDRFDKGVVWVAVEGSAWAQELRLMKPRILSNLNKLANQPGLFTDIRFGVRKLSAPEPEVAPRVLKEEVLKEPLTIREIREKRLKAWRDVDSA